uniref:Uncharacterized protein n=1 Tax=Mycena chlorophos TaxID=658473 RepID=A0ABQ0L3F7_MYCCL|nr:predicted protein [Mycena chlorophos]
MSASPTSLVPQPAYPRLRTTCANAAHPSLAPTAAHCSPPPPHVSRVARHRRTRSPRVSSSPKVPTPVSPPPTPCLLRITAPPTVPRPLTPMPTPMPSA